MKQEYGSVGQVQIGHILDISQHDLFFKIKITPQLIFAAPESLEVRLETQVSMGIMI